MAGDGARMWKSVENGNLTLKEPGTGKEIVKLWVTLGEAEEVIE